MMHYYFSMLSALLVAGVITPGTEAFAPLPTHRASSTRLFATATASTSLTTNTFSGKELQLEEREDKDSSMSELWLNADGSVKIGTTDGPLIESYKGSWSYDQDDKEHPFRMTLVRTYHAGDHTGPNQAGEFDYPVERKFWGDVEVVGGEFVSATGQIHGLDEAAKVDCEVGYFSLIDAASEGVEGEK